MNREKLSDKTKCKSTYSTCSHNIRVCSINVGVGMVAQHVLLCQTGIECFGQYSQHS